MTLDTTRQEMLQDLLLNSGPEGVLALLVLIFGLFLGNRTVHWLRKWLSQFLSGKAVSIICIFISLLLIMVIVSFVAVLLNLPPRPILRVILIGCFVALGVVMLAGPFLPTLPFKPNQLVRLGEHLGIVESITLLNTRLRTFDGQVIYLPNYNMLKNREIINYHHTPTRRVKIDVRIGYSEDLVRVKQILEDLMIADARVLVKPSPAVYVIELGDNGIRLGLRCWVKNANYWFTRCDLTEKIKLRFDCEGIRFPFNQLDVHLDSPYGPIKITDKSGDSFHQDMDNPTKIS